MTSLRTAHAAFLAACFLLSGSAAAQSVARDSSTQKTFFIKRDIAYSAVALAGAAAISHFDVRAAHYAQSSKIQGDSGIQELVSSLTKINELPLTLAAVATYGVGKLAHSPTITDVGLHTAEALVLTIGVSELIRIPVGRRRPRSSPGDQYNFHFGSGLSNFDDRSFPSLHSSAAFATASALSGELKVRNPGAAKFVTPLLYTAALVPGVTRLHLDEHWLSDIAAGAFVGALLGSRVVSYAHSHNRNWLDRMLAGTMVVPNRDGGLLVMATVGR